jgi:hypothetical protein
MHRIHCTAVLLSLVMCGLLIAQPAVNANHAHRDIGEVLIYSDGPDRLVVAMDTDQGHKDGFVDQWFVLQANAPVAETRVHLRAADIRFRDGFLRVISQQDRTVYEFAIDGIAPGAPLEPGYMLVRTEGFGLSRYVSETKLPIAPDGDRCETCEALTLDW